MSAWNRPTALTHAAASVELGQGQLVDLAQGARIVEGELRHPAAHIPGVLPPLVVIEPHREHLRVFGVQELGADGDRKTGRQGFVKA
jgi:hypothetical protein